MRRFIPFLTCIALTAPTLLATHTADAQSRRAVDPRRETAERMLKPITVSFEEARLDDALRFIADFTGANFDVMWLDDQHVDGLDPATMVSVDVENVTALALLERVLARGYQGFDGATWQFAETGELEIGPRSRLNQRAELKMYDIRDLLFTVQAFTEIPDLSLGQIIQGQGGGSANDLTIEDRDRGTDEEEAQRIIDLIVAHIEPDQWRDNGGDGGSITYYNGHLLVRAPDYLHRQLIGYSFWPAASQRASMRTSRRDITTAADPASVDETPAADADEQP